MGLADFFTGSITDTVTEVAKVARTFITTDKDRLEFEQKMIELETNSKLKATELANNYEQQISNRWSDDMKSDSTLAKNIRPITLIYLLSMYSLLSISSGFGFIVTPQFVELLGNWGMLVMTAYFGGRSLEKIYQIKGKT